MRNFKPSKGPRLYWPGFPSQMENGWDARPGAPIGSHNHVPHDLASAFYFEEKQEGLLHRIFNENLREVCAGATVLSGRTSH